MIPMGLGMNGMEDRMCQIAHDVAQRFDHVTYLEIGVAEGVTLTGIALALRQSGKNWRAVGVELPNGYSFNRGRTEEVARRRNVPLEFFTPVTKVHPEWKTVSVYLENSQSFLTEHWNELIHFALIDGCHGRPCVKADFIAIEAFMVPGGVVMFHDFSEEQQGFPQPHCSGGVHVLDACRELGLLSDKRAGWKFTETIPADLAGGGWNMGVFTKEPLKNA